MFVELNFKPGVPNLNNRIYPEDVLEKAVNEAIENNLFIVIVKRDEKDEDIFRKEVNLSKVGARVTKYENNGFEFEYLKTPMADVMKEMLESGDFIVTTSGIGEVEPNEDGVLTIQDNFKLKFLFVTPRDQDE